MIEERKVPANFLFDPWMLDKLKELSSKIDRSQAWIVRKALERYLNEIEKELSEEKVVA